MPIRNVLPSIGPDSYSGETMFGFAIASDAIAGVHWSTVVTVCILSPSFQLRIKAWPPNYCNDIVQIVSTVIRALSSIY